MARIFGVVGAGSSFTGIVVTNLTESENVQIAQARTQQGAVSDMHAYSKEKSIQVDGLVDGSVSISAGQTLTIGGSTYVIESVSTTESNENFKTVSLSAKTADSATITGIDNGSNS